LLRLDGEQEGQIFKSRLLHQNVKLLPFDMQVAREAALQNYERVQRSGILNIARLLSPRSEHQNIFEARARAAFLPGADDAEGGHDDENPMSMSGDDDTMTTLRGAAGGEE
jgi:hypothetical protein